MVAFIRAFKLFKEMRVAVSETITESLKYLAPGREEEVKEAYSEHLSVFEERKLHIYLQNQPSMTLEFVCFHKNWNDKANITTNEEELMVMMQTSGP